MLLLQEPLLAAGRLLDFELRRPGAAQAVLALLGAEYGQQVRLAQLANLQRLAAASCGTWRTTCMHAATCLI
jgi:hypothetical protein